MQKLLREKTYRKQQVCRNLVIKQTFIIQLTKTALTLSPLETGLIVITAKQQLNTFIGNVADHSGFGFFIL